VPEGRLGEARPSLGGQCRQELQRIAPQCTGEVTTCALPASPWVGIKADRYLAAMRSGIVSHCRWRVRVS
jgi:hypothetical protein